MAEKVFYEELTPKEFRLRIKEAPIAYLPLGTLEWHGEHLPLGADGIQSRGFFELLAKRVGGIVLPMLFLGPDRVNEKDGRKLFGMDVCRLKPGEEHYYESGQLDGSAYWVPDQTFRLMLDGIMYQLARAGFKVVVGHGHGPSTLAFGRYAPEWRESLGLECVNCWGSEYDREGLGIQVDHAAMNETSLVMALRPELVRMENLPADTRIWPVGIGGKDPRLHASRELGEKILRIQLDRMAALIKNILNNLDSKRQENT